jgi:large subunit ribosomal protein L34e
MAQRVTLRKRNPYNTTSNRRRVVKTPGGRLVVHHLKKPASAPKCGDCGIGLPGVRPFHSNPFIALCQNR